MVGCVFHVYAVVFWLSLEQKAEQARDPHSSAFIIFIINLLSLLLGFHVIKKEFVQVLHTGRGHWVTISTIDCANGEVDVFDSMPPAVLKYLFKKPNDYNGYGRDTRSPSVLLDP